MGVLFSMSKCPNCGAPISVEGDRRSVICIFCNTSLRVEQPATGDSAAQLAADAVSPDDIEKVKQLLLDGKRDEAIAHYARVASVSVEVATAAVENVSLNAYWTLTRHVPINAFGFLLYTVLIGLGAGLAAFAWTQHDESSIYYLLMVLGGAFALWQVYGFSRHVRSTLILHFGSLGRGKVLRRAVVREAKERQGFFVVVLWEVVPEGGGAAFVDRETLFVGAVSLEKLAPGNVIRVRFDGGRTLVFPTMPITVIGTA